MDRQEKKGFLWTRPISTLVWGILLLPNTG